MNTRKIIMELIRGMETEILKSGLRIDLMRKASKRFAGRGESLKANIAEALMHNEQNQKSYYEGVLAGYKFSLRALKWRD